MVNTSMSFSGGRTNLPHQTNSDTPPNSLKDSDANSKVKTIEEGVRVRFLTCSTSGGKRGMLEFQDGD